jgi:Putative MetA-pathway of phenol degradation
MEMKYALKLTKFAMCVFACSGLRLNAQYLGDQIMGLAGLQAGSQPAPGIYVVLPLYFREGNVSINDAHGDRLLQGLGINVNAFVAPAVSVITPFKILGANYGAAYTQFLTDGLLNVAAFNFETSSGYGFGDLYVQPLILGWHLSHADITAGYAFFAPTGKGTSGQHMWVNEIDLGGTLRPDKDKKWNLSTMMYYDFNRKKNNANIKVGDILTLAGGIGRSFLKGMGNAGVAYGAQWKITHDSGADIPPLLPITNGRAFGIGPEIDLPVFAKKLNLGLVSFRYLWLAGPKTALGGQTLSVSFTFARIIPPK